MREIHEVDPEHLQRSENLADLEHLQPFVQGFPFEAKNKASLEDLLQWTQTHFHGNTSTVTELEGIIALHGGECAGTFPLSTYKTTKFGTKGIISHRKGFFDQGVTKSADTAKHLMFVTHAVSDFYPI